MLESAIPDILIFLGEPQIEEWLIVNVNIDFMPVRETVVSVVLMAPPSAAKAIKGWSQSTVQPHASLSSAMSVIMGKPSGLLKANSNQNRGY